MSNRIEALATYLFGSMREATQEEQECVKKYIESICKPTGINFWDDSIKSIILKHKMKKVKKVIKNGCKTINKFNRKE